MRKWFTQIKFTLKDGLGFAGFWLVRALERVLPVAALYWLLWPVFQIQGFLNILFRRAPKYPLWPPALTVVPGFWERVRAKREHYFHHLLRMFPDRLSSPKWQVRCQIHGLAPLAAAAAAKRPAILTFMHAGPFFIMHHWLRAQGLPVAGFFGDLSRKRRRFFRFRDRLGPLPQVPVALHLDELRETIQFVQGGGMLFISADTPSDRLVTVPFDADWQVTLSTGGWRLAARHGAVCVPVWITAVGPWRYQVGIGEPAPAKLLAAADGGAAGTAYLMAQLAPVLRAHPGQCGLKCAFQPRPSP
ncbi:MAG TPA: hypothetical protein VF607_00055 [Verrucomicrobiae bacterium]